MKNYDVVIYTKGKAPHVALVHASNPVGAMEVALRQAARWPDDEKANVVGVTLKPEPKKEGDL